VSSLNRLISVAPMMNCTDRHARYFLRLIAPSVLLYTEMITSEALIHGDYARLLAFDSLEHPVALQLGGSEPSKLKRSAQLAEDFGYDEVNLNVGCPSHRVKAGRFGACLMLEPDRVAECVSAMCAAVKIPVTVKCRIGVDHEDSYEKLAGFVQKVSEAGCRVFIIHARKAWLTGISPKQNREIPPLQYEVVRQIKRDFQALSIVINGGIKTVKDVEEHLPYVEGVMIGREAYSNPYFLAALQEKFFLTPSVSRKAVIEKFIPYIQDQLKNKVKLSSVTRHILGLYQGQKGARIWRRYLSERVYGLHAGIEIIQEALQYV